MIWGIAPIPLTPFPLWGKGEINANAGLRPAFANI